MPLSRRRAETFRQHAAPRRPRRGMGIFAGAIALTSVSIAAWNAYWLADPLRAALRALVG